MKFIVTILVSVFAALNSHSVLHADTLSAEFLAGKAQQESDVSTTQKVSGDGVSLGIRLSYMPRSYAGLETAYRYYGRAEDDYSRGEYRVEHVSISSAYQLGFVGKLSITPRLFLAGRVGFSSWRYRSEVDSPLFKSSLYASIFGRRFW